MMLDLAFIGGLCLGAGVVLLIGLIARDPPRNVEAGDRGRR